MAEKVEIERPHGQGRHERPDSDPGRHASAEDPPRGEHQGNGEEVHLGAEPQPEPRQQPREERGGITLLPSGGRDERRRARTEPCGGRVIPEQEAVDREGCTQDREHGQGRPRRFRGLLEVRDDP